MLIQTQTQAQIGRSLFYHIRNIQLKYYFATEIQMQTHFFFRNKKCFNVHFFKSKKTLCRISSFSTCWASGGNISWVSNQPPSVRAQIFNPLAFEPWKFSGRFSTPRPRVSNSCVKLDPPVLTQKVNARVREGEVVPVKDKTWLCVSWSQMILSGAVKQCERL